MSRGRAALARAFAPLAVWRRSGVTLPILARCCAYSVTRRKNDSHAGDWPNKALAASRGCHARNLPAEQRDGRGRGQQRHGAEEHQRPTQAEAERPGEDETPEALPREQGEDVHPHRLPPAGTEIRHDPGQQRLRHVVAEGEGGHEQGGGEHRQIEGQGGSRGAGDRQASGHQPAAPQRSATRPMRGPNRKPGTP